MSAFPLTRRAALGAFGALVLPAMAQMRGALAQPGLRITDSLLAQIHAWLPVAIASARNQRHTWTEIAEQLQITPAAARRRHHAYLESTPCQHLD